MDKVVLHSLDTVAGLLERVMLHETRSPQYGRLYDRDQSLKAMRLMRQVIYNRITFQKMMGGPAVSTPLDVVTLRNQFANFEDYPNLSGDFMSAVTHMVQYANDPADKRNAVNRQHVLDAITAATEVAPPADSVIAKVLAWRTEGARGPGARFRPVMTLQGNTFYNVPDAH